jgi:hypothetical protein
VVSVHTTTQSLGSSTYMDRPPVVALARRTSRSPRRWRHARAPAIRNASPSAHPLQTCIGHMPSHVSTLTPCRPDADLRLALLPARRPAGRPASHLIDDDGGGGELRFTRSRSHARWRGQWQAGYRPSGPCASTGGHIMRHAGGATLHCSQQQARSACPARRRTRKGYSVQYVPNDRAPPPYMARRTCNADAPTDDHETCTAYVPHAFLMNRDCRGARAGDLLEIEATRRGRQRLSGFLPTTRAHGPPAAAKMQGA